MAGKECFEERAVLRNCSCVLCGPEHPQNFDTRGIFIHLCRSWTSVRIAASSVSGGEDGVDGEGSVIVAAEM